MAKKAKSMSGGKRGRGPSPRNRRGRRGKHRKRSPFSGSDRDIRARYERISQRDRKMEELQIRATGKLVSAPRDGAPATPAEGGPIEAVEFNAADDPEAPGTAAAQAAPDPKDADDAGELADDSAEPADVEADDLDDGDEEDEEEEADEDAADDE